ncbi:MAG TPA: hypothetical protein VNG32_03145 [Candidatus Dormibacteraeota bacterium]|nr:hypothetical protein [Candidatus Dormibacteraeota bacterium]
MPPHPSTPETSSRRSLSPSAITAIAVIAGVATGFIASNQQKSGRNRTKPNAQITRELDSDWTKLEARMETVAHNTNNPQLIVDRRRTDITGGAGIGAVATVLTIKDGSIGQLGDSRYGFTAKVVEQSKDPKSQGVPPLSSFNVNFYGYVPSGLPFKKLIDMNGQNKLIDNAATQPYPNNFSFSMEKGTDQSWSLSIQSDYNLPGATHAAHKAEPIDPSAATSLVNQLSEDIGYLLIASNTPPGSPVLQSFQS